MTTPCPQSPKGLPCLFAPHRVGNEQRTLLACLTCGRPKPEPCYFVEQGKADREAMR